MADPFLGGLGGGPGGFQPWWAVESALRLQKTLQDLQLEPESDLMTYERLLEQTRDLPTTDRERILNTFLSSRPRLPRERAAGVRQNYETRLRQEAEVSLSDLEMKLDERAQALLDAIPKKAEAMNVAPQVLLMPTLEQIGRERTQAMQEWELKHRQAAGMPGVQKRQATGTARAQDPLRLQLNQLLRGGPLGPNPQSASPWRKQQEELLGESLVRSMLPGATTAPLWQALQGTGQPPTDQGQTTTPELPGGERPGKWPWMAIWR